MSEDGAQVKFLMGRSSNISLESTPFEDGSIHFTADDGTMYVDTVVDGEQKRIPTGKREVISSVKPEGLTDGDTWLREVT